MSDIERDTAKEKTPFARILRFWRNVFGMSQEELSHEVEVSTRHLSFLESGRSKPSRTAVLKIAEAFDLGYKDTNTLLVSANFPHQHLGLGLDSPELHLLRKSLIFILSRQDPFPTCVYDRHKNVLMINKAWLSLFRDNTMPGMLEVPLNIYRLFLKDQNLRMTKLNWEDLACALLLDLQQEILMTNDSTMQNLMDEILTYPNIPENWQRRAVDVGHIPYHKIRLQLKDGSTRTFLVANNTVGMASYALEPNLVMSTLYVTDNETYSTKEKLDNDDSLKHPLLFY